uniref:Crinkler (CRN) family protein n=1 Tax=Attheya septentrionalis TaxID=420275 RepID=A0A7S2XUH1_9STRA|mmetsp:Transcript_3074/g.5602  ORF Transcript_3074/g.5602 Transcript_3074/m.5602 type:complete len:754 (+) Transcript_3074:133-2394(+)
MATEAAATTVEVKDKQGNVLGKVNVGDTRTQVLERLGCSGGLFDKNNLGLLGEDCITLEGAPYQFREPPPQQNAVGPPTKKRKSFAAIVASFFPNRMPAFAFSETKLLIEITKNTGSRRFSLDKEKEKIIPSVKEKDRPILGQHLKFVNREKSVNHLMKHAAEQFDLYLRDGGLTEHRAQWAACSGGPGLGKTTFCRKAFTKAVDACPNGPTEANDCLWKGVDNKEDFYRVVKTCVVTGRQYRISFGGSRMIADAEFLAPDVSFASRLTSCLTTKARAVPNLHNLLLRLTGGVRSSLVVINFDETNMLLKHTKGTDYLLAVLAAVQAFNREHKGFVFCIMSGTNVHELHEVLKVSSNGQAPLEIPLPLLQHDHVLEILMDLASRCSDDGDSATVGDHVSYVLDILGGVPRYIEVLVFLLGMNNKTRCFNPAIYPSRLFNDSDQNQPHCLLDKIKTAISAKYGESFVAVVAKVTREALSPLLATSLFQWSITRDDMFGEHTIGDLESKGILFVEQTNDPTSPVAKYTTAFPLLLLTYLFENGDATANVPMLLRNFDFKLSSDQNEKNTLAIFALKCEALAALKKPITVNALLPGNAQELEWQHEAMSFDSFEVQDAQSQVTMTTWNSYLSKLTTGGGFLVNAKGTPFCDMIIVAKGGTRVILIQEKQAEVAKAAAIGLKRVPTLDYALVEREHKKCEVNTSHLFVMISDKDFTSSDMLKGNEIVLSATNHVDAFGPLLALLRLHNHGHRSKLHP